jgi:hypothetical protein
MPKHEVQRTRHPKISGREIGEFCGLRIYGKLRKAKRRGKDRVWIQIRQDEPKPLHVAECLSYARSVDILFATDWSH